MRACDADTAFCGDLSLHGRRLCNKRRSWHRLQRRRRGISAGQERSSLRPSRPACLLIGEHAQNHSRKDGLSCPACGVHPEGLLHWVPVLLLGFAMISRIRILDCAATDGICRDAALQDGLKIQEQATQHAQQESVKARLCYPCVGHLENVCSVQLPGTTLSSCDDLFAFCGQETHTS